MSMAEVRAELLEGAGWQEEAQNSLTWAQRHARTIAGLLGNAHGSLDIAMTASANAQIAAEQANGILYTLTTGADMYEQHLATVSDTVRAATGQGHAQHEEVRQALTFVSLTAEATTSFSGGVGRAIDKAHDAAQRYSDVAGDNTAPTPGALACSQAIRDLYDNANIGTLNEAQDTLGTLDKQSERTAGLGTICLRNIDTLLGTPPPANAETILAMLARDVRKFHWEQLQLGMDISAVRQTLSEQRQFYSDYPEASASIIASLQESIGEARDLANKFR